MLSPKELQEIADTMYPLLDDLNVWITKDVIRRMMARMARGEDPGFSASDKWQLRLYQDAAGHYDALQQEIKKWTQLSDQEVQAIFEDAAIRAWAAEDAFYTAQGYESVKLLKSESLMNILADTYQRTNGTIHNFTRTIAKASEQRFINTCDKAHLKVITGAQSYTGAVAEAVEELAGSQLTVSYPSGHIDTIETAVLRCVRTGTAQASGNMTLQGMLDHDWDVILVSAHLGARYGDGGENPGNHFWWQGKHYTYSGRTPGLPRFTVTGYGTGEGLCGWNCRHSFGPGIVGHNPYEAFDAEENKRAYDLSQRQRRMERGIRHTKTKLIGYQEAIANCEDAETKEELQRAYDSTALKLKRQNEAYNKFCKDNDLRRLDDRLATAKWDREQAKRAAKGAKNREEALANAKQSGGKETVGSVEWAERRDQEAEEYYERVRSSDDVQAVAQSSGMSVEDIQTIKEHVFYKDHLKYDGELSRFDADYNMAVAWKRLAEGVPESRDLLLLQHELLESQFEMRYNCSASKAHAYAESVYPWDKEVEKLLGEAGEKDGLLQSDKIE